MNKKEFRDLVLDSAKELTGETYLKRDGELMINAVSLALEKVLVNADEVELPGLGKFKTSMNNPRQVKGIDGKTHDIAARRVVAFKPSISLKRSVAQGIFRATK